MERGLTHPGLRCAGPPSLRLRRKEGIWNLYLHASLRGTKQSPTYRDALYSIEIINIVNCPFKVLMNFLRSVVFVPRNDGLGYFWYIYVKQITMSNECRLKLEWVPEAYKEVNNTSKKSASTTQKLVKPLVREGQSLKISKRKYRR